MADNFEHISESVSLFDKNGKFSSNPVDGFSSGLEKAFSLWQQINAEQAKYFDEQATSAEAFDQLQEDIRKKQKAQWDKEIQNRKNILKIQMQIEDAKKKGNREEQNNLKKRLELVQKTQDIEKKTQQIVDKYSEDMETRAALRKAEKENLEARQNILKDGLKAGNLNQIKDALSGGESGVKGLGNALNLLGNLIQQLDTTIQDIAKYRGTWDTRLYGSNSSHTTLTKSIQYALGASPYVKQSEVLKNIDKAIESGIAYNIEQRAFLQTIKDEIAGTFDAFDSTLLQIVRVQQSDSTASRMGMEAALNEYLNRMFKNTEYLSNISDTVTGALYQATSLLNSTQSIGFEYQIQKWLGSLYSVGMSNQSVSSIAQALGQLASGDVSGTSNGAGKLLVMAASRAGLSYSDLLTKGINDSDINSLMESMVEYLRTIADSNKVVQTQLAGIYGLSTSDIKAASNLSDTDITNIYSNGLDYNQGINSLNKMARTLGSRVSIGEMMTNLIDNFKFTFASGIAGNPVLYSLWTISNMLDEFTGGINIPAISVMGNMVDLETTVADIMRVGAVSGGLLSGIGSIVSGLANNSLGLQGVLSALGVSKTATTMSRGQGLSAGLSQNTATTSQIGYIGNTAGSDVYDSTMMSAEDQKTKLAVAAQEEEQNDIKLADLNNTALKIYDLLASVISGGKLTVTSAWNDSLVPDWI